MASLLKEYDDIVYREGITGLLSNKLYSKPSNTESTEEFVDKMVEWLNKSHQLAYQTSEKRTRVAPNNIKKSRQTRTFRVGDSVCLFSPAANFVGRGKDHTRLRAWSHRWFTRLRLAPDEQ